jgi:hypothetical protein
MVSQDLAAGAANQRGAAQGAGNAFPVHDDRNLDRQQKLLALRLISRTRAHDQVGPYGILHFGLADLGLQLVPPPALRHSDAPCRWSRPGSDPRFPTLSQDLRTAMGCFAVLFLPPLVLLFVRLLFSR